LLPAIRIEKLPEVALLVQQSDADERIILIASGLQVVARENAKTARINRQAFRQPIFRREIGDQLAVRRRSGTLYPRVVSLASRAVKRQVPRVLGRFFQGGLGQPAEHQYGVVPAFSPKGRVKPPKDGANDRLPTPEDVVSQVGQTGQSCGNGRA